jgi:hypothetical protein
MASLAIAIVVTGGGVQVAKPILEAQCRSLIKDGREWCDATNLFAGPKLRVAEPAVLGLGTGYGNWVGNCDRVGHGDGGDGGDGGEEEDDGELPG